MIPDIRHAAVIGAGAIGASWCALLTSHGIDVVVADPAPDATERLAAALHEVSDDPVIPTVVASASEAARGADIVFEAGPERLDVKQALFAELDAATAPEVVLASSSSGLRPSEIQLDCVHPERVLVAHPFNPPHLMPLVEVVGGRLTSESAIDTTMSVLRELGKTPVRLRRELPGHVANRLQAALWREAYHLVAQGAISASDLDLAISSGPGLRWALLGPLATQHLSGGPGGMAHVLDHLGPPMVDWWDDLGTPELTPQLIDTVVTGVTEELGGRESEVARARNEALAQLLELKIRYGLDRSPSDQPSASDHSAPAGIPS
ncbi:3-hydroxyacyl-CoA dehydrogenase NAD-binding domain-containing protein [Gordonia jinhuaensis]|uniref:Hydroxyacyl-CoA dehydrogenase n=2 Tax=Gordonia jinhuaensis TaxID=1517702 RepID=A0A916TCI3_9ACTN|nr:hydroxyacyl-CoA dehydrogenase [Gordonia jinhuaensis]